MKIFFVNPPTLDDQKYIREGRCMQSVNSWAAIWPPLTLAILASIAKKYGAVRLIDWNVEDMSFDAMVHAVVSFEPDILVSCPTFPSIDSDAFFSKTIKEKCPRTITVGFGMFFTLLQEASLRDTEGYDIAIYGEPEVTFEEFLSTYAASGKIQPLQGLIWREGDQIKKGDPRPLIQDLDTIPNAARDLFKNDRYKLPNNGHPFTLINVARGCPYPCTFCTATV
jgi:anaerobic magnesium-protoporphyrin IX monomethyl ester cyclase